MKHLPALILMPLLTAGGVLAACGAQDTAGPAAPPATPPASDAPFVDPSLGPRRPAGSAPGPATTLRPGQGVPPGIDCGAFTLGQTGRLPDEAARCFVDAAQAGHPARLQVTRPTVEGDPIPVTYTAGADGRVTVVTDSRQDGFGPQEVTSRTCQGPLVAARGIDFTRCSEPAPVKS